MISREKLDSIPLFHGISAKAAIDIRDHLPVRTFVPGGYVFFRGEPGNSMFILLKGKVIVTLTNDEGHEYTIATLRRGSFFGELALIAGEPRSAHIKVIDPTVVAEIDQKAYADLTRSFPEFDSRLMQVMRKRVAKSRVQWQGERVKSVKGVSRSLLPVRNPVYEECLPGKTEWTKNLNQSVEEIGPTDANVLISGESGTERFFVARLIVSRSRLNYGPLITLNCSTPPKVHRENAVSALEDSQESAMFGHEAGSTAYALGLRRGYLDIADAGTLVLDHVEDLVPKVQIRLLEYLRSSRFRRIGGVEQLTRKVRIIATTTGDLDEMVKDGRFDKELLQLLRERTVTILPLRQRREDIPALTQEFLMRYRRRNQEVGKFSAGAMDVLLHHNWPLNFVELSRVISQAISVSQGRTMEEEHIFFDIRSSFQPSGGINLLRNRWVSALLRNRLIPGVFKYFTVPFFLLLIYYTLFGPREHNLGNVIAWSLLWPFLLLSVLVSARSFCAYCPISALSDIFAIGRRTFVSLPGFMKKYGIWIGIAVYVSVFWIEHVTEAFINTRVTGMVFVAISGGAVLTTLFFGKRIWCIHICPLGSMLGSLAALSILELRANGTVCVWQCENRPCLRENNCPMELHPSSERTRHDCVLCLNCVRKCKQKSVHLDLLRPHERVLAMNSWDLPRTVFVMLLIGSVISAQSLKWLNHHEEATASLNLLESLFHTHYTYFAAGVSLAAGYAAVVFLLSRMKQLADWLRNFVIAGSAYLPLAFIGLFNFYFGQFILQANDILPLSARLLGIDRIVHLQQPGVIKTVLPFLPPVLTIVSGILSIYLLRKLHDQHRFVSSFYMRHQLLILVTSVVFLLLL